MYIIIVNIYQEYRVLNTISNRPHNIPHGLASLIDHAIKKAMSGGAIPKGTNNAHNVCTQCNSLVCNYIEALFFFLVHFLMFSFQLS